MAIGDDRIFLIVGDLGYGQVESFRGMFPSRFINAGVAEQNMTGLAAGLAMSGKVVFTYSIGNFSTMRCLEQIRNDVCYHNASVNIVSVGGGYAYGALGMSHHATEDLAIMRSLPNMRVVAPGDSWETEMATRAMVNEPGPHYLRLSKAPDWTSEQLNQQFTLGKAREIVRGTDVCLICTGSMLELSLDASKLLQPLGISARVISMHTVEPIDEAAVRKVAQECKVIVTVEEHSVQGGLGTSVSEVISELGPSDVFFKRIGLPPNYCSLCGSREFLLKSFGLTVERIVYVSKELYRKQTSAHTNMTIGEPGL